MIDSILTSVKKDLGIQEQYTHFDDQIILAINTAFLNLNQFGIGPDAPFMITGSSEIWDNFIAPGFIESVKKYVPLKVRLLFDPPQSVKSFT